MNPLRPLFACLSLAFAAPAIAQPDLSGHWSNASSTLLERDPKFAGRLTMTDEGPQRCRTTPRR
jgi:hypothetical protein